MRLTLAVIWMSWYYAIQSTTQAIYTIPYLFGAVVIGHMQYGHVGKLIEDKKYDPPLSFSMLIYPFVNFTYENKNKLVENSHRPNVTNSLIIGSVVPFISPQHSVYYSVGCFSCLSIYVILWSPQFAW